MEKTILMTALLILSFAYGKAQTGNITVNVSDIEKVEGDIYFLIYKKDDGFPKEKEKAYKTGKVSNYKTKASFTFEDIPFGTYAIAFFQDENGNGTLDNNFIGIPKEPVGASNMTSLGRPSFKKCKFQLNSESKEMTLTFVL
ncbi:MAG: DUF2141 domain-containing protein [Bacteroidota bacterium]